MDGRSCSAQVLRDAGETLVSLTGQHAARRLVDAAYQRDLLDRFAGLDSQRRAVAGAHRKLGAARTELQAAREQLAESGRREELLRHEIELVRALDPQPGEQDTLNEERARLRHADELFRGVHTALALLSGEDETTPAVDLVARAADELTDAGEHDPQLAAVAGEVADISERLAEAARSLRDLIDAYEADPARLEEVEQRLFAFQDLRRRYGGIEIEQLLERIDADARELELLQNADAHIAALETAVTAAEQAYDTAAGKLTQARKTAAGKLSKATETHLHELGLTGARFLVEFEAITPGPYGTEKVSFMLQANKGLKPAALDRGASGGELSRVNLALLLAAEADAGCLIFDEVDAGIGGEVAHVLARKLRALSEHTQVIVITHLAQIAVQADRHFKVEKSAGSGKTVRARVRELDTDDRDREIARLIGADQTEATQAADLVRRAAGLIAA